MLHKKAKKAGKEPGDALRASVKKEMAAPRMAKSARTMERTLDRSRNSSTVKHRHAWNSRQNNSVSQPETAGRGVDWC
jgi:hypothetical protein